MELTVVRRIGPLLLAACAAALALACGSSRHPLPTYEPPLARTNYQNVRTTAYTHTESDHLAYGNHSAIGGILRAASIPDTPLSASAVAVAPPYDLPVSGRGGDGPADYGFQRRGLVRPAANVPVAAAAPNHVPGSIAYPAPFGGSAVYPPPASRTSFAPSRSTVYGSAAADWSRWPVGTVFQLASTGQIYRVDDYGWALAGRNTIDLYQPTRGAMNAWGVRREALHILRWGSREESLQRLRHHQDYRHIKRMVLELEGHDRAAAKLE